MDKKNLITEFVYPEKGWVVLPTGFFVDGSFNPGLIVWDFGDGGPKGGKTVDHTFDTPSIHKVTVTVYDGNGGFDNRECKVDIKEQACSNFSLTQQKSAIYQGDDPKITIGATPWLVLPDSAVIDWGDENPPVQLQSPVEFAKVNWPNLHHSYSSTGVHYGSIKAEWSGNSCEQDFVVVVGKNVS